MIIAKKYISALLSAALLVPVWLRAGDEIVNEQNFSVTKLTESSEDAAQAPDFASMLDPQVVANIMQNMIKMQMAAEERKREKSKRLYETLPPYAQNLIKDATLSYDSFVQQISLRHGFAALLKSIHDRLSLLNDNPYLNEHSQEVKAALIAFEEVVQRGGVFVLLQGNDIQQTAVRKNEPMFAEQEHIQQLLKMFAVENDNTQQDVPQVTYTISELRELLEHMVAIFSDNNQLVKNELSSEQKLLVIDGTYCLGMLQSIVERNFEHFFSLFFSYVQPVLHQAENLFDKILLEFGLILEGKSTILGDFDTSTHTDIRLLKESLAWWSKNLAQQRTSLRVFNDIRHRGSSAYTHILPTLKVFAYSYDLVLDHLFSICKKDLSFYKEPTFGWRSLSIYMSDYTLRASMVMGYFIDAQNKNMQQTLMQILGGDVEVSSLTRHDHLFGLCKIIASSLPLFGTRTLHFGTPHALMRASSKLVVSALYYNAVYARLFGYDETPGWWDASDGHSKDAMMGIINEVKKMTMNTIYESLYSNIQAETLEGVYDGTWGVIRPELAGMFITLAFDKLLLEKPFYLDRVINLDRFDIYGSWYSSLYNGGRTQHYEYQRDAKRPSKTTYNTLKSAGDRYIYATHKFYGQDLDLLYFEHAIVSYVISSIAGYWGDRLGVRYKSFVGKALMTGYDCMLEFGKFIHLLDEQEVQGYKEETNEIIEQFDTMLFFVKQKLREILTPGSQEFMTICDWLMTHDYIKQGESDLEVIRVACVRAGLYHLTKLRLPGGSRPLLSVHRAAKILQHFNQVPSMDYVVDELIDAFKDGLSGWFVGTISEYATRWGASMIYAKSGPFYPKVKAYLNKK